HAMYAVSGAPEDVNTPIQSVVVGLAMPLNVPVTFVPAATLAGLAVSVVATPPPVATRHAPRPWANANKFGPAPTLPMTSASVMTWANLVTSTAQFAPPSVEENTPMSVPMYNRAVFAGSTTIACTGTSGTPVAPLPSMDVHVAPPSMLFQTCGTPKVEYVAYTMLSFVGSNASPARYAPFVPAGWLTLQAVALVALNALVVRLTQPVLIPARTWFAFVGDTAIALTLPVPHRWVLAWT